MIDPMAASPPSILVRYYPDRFADGPTPATMNRLRAISKALAAVVLCALLVTPPCAWADGDRDRKAADEEIELGRKAAAENDKQVKLVTDPAILDRVTRIGNELAAIANTIEVPMLWGRPGLKQLPYTFKVVEDKDVNAYSLPGGFIYVNTGLLDFVKSDDELAGVLGHEIAHAAHHHMMRLISEQEKMQWIALGPALASILLGKGGTDTTSNLLLAGQLYMIAKLNTYGVEAEKDSDHAAVYYMSKSRYNPVGLLTFMERLGRRERLRPEVELGIYRTHPPSIERSQSMIALLTQLKIPINRRAVDPTIGARVETVTHESVTYADVTMNGTRIIRLADAGATSADTRAKTLAETVNRLFDDNLVSFDLALSGDKTRVLARRRTLIAVSEADARGAGQTVQATAEGALNALRNLLWQDQFNRTPTTASVP